MLEPPSFFELVNTYDAFKISTSMVDTLQMNATTMNDLTFTTWLSAFSGDGAPNIASSLLAVKSVTVDTVYAASVSDQNKEISRQFIDTLIKKLLAPLRSIGTARTLDKTYLASMRDSFIGMYCAWYTIISNRISKIPSATVYSAYFPMSNDTVIHDKANTLMDTIEASLYNSFEPSMSHREWIDKAGTIVSNSSTDVYNQQIFLCCMQPFIIFKYITCFIADAEVRPDNQAPRDVRIRRYAILSVYMFIFHTVFAAYTYASTVNPFNSDTNNLAAILDNVTNLFEAEKRAIDVTNQLDILELEANTLTNLSRKLKDANVEINLTFANQGTITQIDDSFDDQLRSSTIWKRVWNIAFIVTLLLHCTFLTVGGKLHVYSIALSSTWLLILSTSLLIRMYS